MARAASLAQRFDCRRSELRDCPVSCARRSRWRGYRPASQASGLLCCVPIVLCEKSAIFCRSDTLRGSVAAQARLASKLILQSFTPVERRNVVNGGVGNVRQRFAGKESLMAGDDYVGKREQSAEYVIANNETGAVFKKISSSSS